MTSTNILLNLISPRQKSNNCVFDFVLCIISSILFLHLNHILEQLISLDAIDP